MQFELTKEYLDDLSDAIAEGRDSFLESELEELHPADIAEIFDKLKAPELNYLFKLLESEKAADVMIELDEDDREKLLSTLTSKEIAHRVIDNIDSDDAADVLAELTDEKQAEVISHITDDEQRSDISDLLRYDEDSAGGIMAKELVKVRQSWTIARSIREMRKQAEDIDDVYTIYVTDDEDKLVGTLSLKDLLFSSSSIKATIADIYSEQPLNYVYPDTSGEDCSNTMEKYDLVVLPVVDHDMTLLGRITIDDVVDLIKEEAERDYQLASGISESVESDDTVWLLTRARLPWLLIGLLGGVLVAQVIGVFEKTLAEVVELMVFVPLIAAMGGNVGVQSSAIVVQGLANKTIGTGSILQKLTKELMVALVNGLICGLVILAYSILFMDSLALSYTVGIALFSVVIIAALFGTLVPLVLDKVKIDPALATGPFITTMNDIIGLSVYFIYAKFFFGL
ncbi:magnesium transporter [Cryomorphaceae bacterium 1068]|nr:magnesium transporter [Cryomorphaceae bacterium 1068]